MRALVMVDDGGFRETLHAVLGHKGVKDIVCIPSYLLGMTEMSRPFDLAVIEWDASQEQMVRALRAHSPGVCVVAFCRPEDRSHAMEVVNVPVEVGAVRGREFGRLGEAISFALDGAAVAQR